MPQSATLSRILIRLPNWVGDILMALPAVQAVRAHLPEARLVGMVRPEHVEFAKRISAFDEVVAAAPRSGDDRRKAWWRSVRALRAERLQAAILLGLSFEAALTSFVARIPLRIGHATDRRSFLLTRSIPAKRSQHRVDGLLDLVAAIGAAPFSGDVPLTFRRAEREYADQLFEQAGIDAGTRPVLVNPAAAKPPRAWSSERFQQLADLLAERHAGLPVLVHNHPPFEPAPGWPAHPAIRLVKGVSLVQLGAIVERCGLYVGNDSGPMHLAAALGVPTIGIYGPSSPDLTSPRGAVQAPHLAVSAFFECSPCRERFFEECPSPPTADGRPPCLAQVSVETVADQVDRLLAALTVSTDTV